MPRFLKGLRWEQAAILIAAVVCLALGAGWGLPDAHRVVVLLNDYRLSDRDKSMLTTARQAKNEEREAWRGEVAQRIQKGEQVGVFRNEYEGDAILTDEQRFFSFGSFLLNGSAHDEGQTYHALASMRPARLDFDPHMFIYGGSYLYPLGAAIFGLKSVGALHVTRDYGYYLAAPNQIARLYLVGRAFNIVAFLGILILLAKLGNKMGGRFCATASMIAWLFSTQAIDQTLISKPHVYAAFWSLLGIYILVRNQTSPSWRSICLSGICAGWAMGASLVAFLIAIPLTFILFDRHHAKQTVQRLVVIYALMAGVYLIANPYVLIQFNEFRITLRGHGSAEGYGYGIVSFQKLHDFCMALFTRDYFFPASLGGLIALIGVAIRGTNWPRRLAIGTLFMIVAGGISMAVPRIALFMGPPICLFIGFALARIWTAAAKSSALARLSGAGLIVLLVLPGAFFAALSFRDVICDEAWYKPAIAWLREAHIGDRTTFGIFGSGQPHPATTPPFPFIQGRVVNLAKYRGREIQPDYVIVSNDDLDQWNRHPLRAGYKLVADLGNRPSYHWLERWRVPSQSQTAAWVYAK